MSFFVGSEDDVDPLLIALALSLEPDEDVCE